MDYQPRVYLAGPIQHSHSRGKGWRERIKQRESFTWVDPLAKYDSMADADDEWSDERIVEEDLRLIDGCRALLVHWEEVPTCGTPMEMRYAYERDIPTLVQTTVPDHRLSPWLTHHAMDVVEDFDTAEKRLRYALWADRTDTDPSPSPNGGTP
jgi:nucleoside 2-deoxyribosyltransferase